MLPPTLHRRLAWLQSRERSIKLIWSATRWLWLLVLLLAGACAIDWTMDLYRDTPLLLRAGMLLGQMLVWCMAAMFVGVCLSARRSDDDAALWVEARVPRLGHRLISSVQLNRPEALTAGMSPELIQTVAREADDEMARINVRRLIDHRRLIWSALLIASVLLLVGVPSLLWPDTVRALLARQLLSKQDIPRSLVIQPNTPRIQPLKPPDAGRPAANESADEDPGLLLRFQVTGKHLNEEATGRVRLHFENGDSTEFELKHEVTAADGSAIFVAPVGHIGRDFTYDAWLEDGRTHQPGGIHFELTPVVQQVEAWTLLPATVGSHSDGSPFEESQKGGDIIQRFPGETARIKITVHKPIASAYLEFLGPATRAGTVVEVVHRTLPMDILADQPDTAVITVDLHSFLSDRPEQLLENAYRVVVTDLFGFENSYPPQRNIRRGPLDPPDVTLLTEAVEGDDPLEDREIEGIPVALGKRFRLDYICKSPYGLNRAWLRYRVIKKFTTREEDPSVLKDSDFLRLPLGGERPLDPDKVGKRSWSEFQLYSDLPDWVNGTRGQGGYDFESAGIPDGKGGLLQLEIGDRIQFFVEVTGLLDAQAAGRSTLREKEVVDDAGFFTWLAKRDDHKEKIRELEEKQRGKPTTTRTDKPPAGSGSHTVDAPPGPAKLAFGRSWQLLGVLPNPEEKGLDKVFPIEEGPTNLTKRYDGLNGKLLWQPYLSPTDKIDLEKFFTHGKAGVAYAVCWFRCAKGPAILATGSDDGIKVWLDRKEVWRKLARREAVPREDKTPVQLEDGWHELLVKIDNRDLSWAFYLELLDARTNKPREDLEVRITPPGTEENRFVRTWQIIGPLENADGKGHDKAYPPEVDNVDLKKEYDGRDGKIRWQLHKSTKSRIDLQKVFNLADDKTAGVAYAVCWVESDKVQRAQIACGSHDGIKIWVNRRLDFNRAGERDVVAGNDKVPIVLITGFNEILVKLDNQKGDWAFLLELLDERGELPLDGVEMHVTPAAP
jgi:hypothetical protein